MVLSEAGYIIVPLKLKYRVPFTSPRHGYRTRTGPMCCNAGCGSRRKKRRKPVRIRPTGG